MSKETIEVDYRMWARRNAWNKICTGLFVASGVVCIITFNVCQAMKTRTVVKVKTVEKPTVIYRTVKGNLNMGRVIKCSQDLEHIRSTRYHHPSLVKDCEDRMDNYYTAAEIEAAYRMLKEN